MPTLNREGLLVVDGELGGICDGYIGYIDLGDDDGIAVGVPGEVWADRYIAIRVHEGGRSITDDEGYERDSLFIDIPLDRLDEFRALLDKAVAILAQRDAEETP